MAQLLKPYFPVIAIIPLMGIVFAILVSQIVPAWLIIGLIVAATLGLAFFYRPGMLPYVVLLSLVIGQLVRLRLSDEATSSALLPIDVANGIYVAIGASYAFMRRKPFKGSLSLILFGALAGWAFITLLFGFYWLSTQEILVALFYSFRFLLMCGTLLVTVWLFHSEILARQLTRAFIIAGVLLVILGYLQIIFFPDFEFMTQFGWDPHEGRLLSTFFDPNFFGIFLTFLFALLLGQWFYPSAISYRPLTLILMVLTISAIALTLSRSSYLALLMCVLVILTIRSWKLMALTLLVVGITIFSVPKIRTRILGATRIDATAQDRLSSWQDTFYVIKQAPLTGVGYNAFGPAQLRYGLRSNLLGHASQGSDSSLLLIWATMGIIGLLLYGLIGLTLMYESVLVFRKSHSSYFKSMGLAMLGILPAYLVHSQFVNSFFYPLVLIPFMLITSCLIIGLSHLKAK